MIATIKPKLLKNYLDNIFSKLIFTLDIEENNKINFLDLSLEKKSNRFEVLIDNLLHPTTPNHQFIPRLQTKNCSLQQASYGLLNVPLSQDKYEEEFNTIKLIAESNGYQTSIVDRLKIFF